jgi:CBS domain containing-hemolysin-like protein
MPSTIEEYVLCQGYAAMTALILSVFVAMSVSALCSFMEAALYSVPWSHVERMRKSGKPSGMLLFNLRSSIERPITAVLTLNTIANTAGAAVAGSYAAAVIGDKNMPLFATGFTLAILICSEIIPKTLGVIYCRQASVFMAHVISALVMLLKPLIWFSGLITRLITSGAKLPPATQEDVTAMVSLLCNSGHIKPHEETVINNILVLHKKAVRDIMTPRTVACTLPADCTAAEAHIRPGFWHYSRVPVYGDDYEDIIGLVSRRRILEELAADRPNVVMGSLMRPIHFVLESLPLDNLLLRFLDERVQFFAALDEFGGFAGIVTLEDVVEEILGREIVDETDEVPDLRELARKRRSRLLQGA